MPPVPVEPAVRNGSPKLAKIRASGDAPLTAHFCNKIGQQRSSVAKLAEDSGQFQVVLIFSRFA